MLKTSITNPGSVEMCNISYIFVKCKICCSRYVSYAFQHCSKLYKSCHYKASQMQCCTKWTTEQVYYVSKAMELSDAHIKMYHFTSYAL